MGRILLIAVLVAVAPAAAQESASYRIERGQLGSLGSAVDVTSAGYSISRASLGEPAVQRTQTSANYAVETGWTAALRPALEVAGVRFEDGATLAWTPDPALGGYRVYRGLAAELPSQPATCLAEIGLSNLVVAAVPSAGAPFYYLVTAVDGAAIEGPAGVASDGSPRAVTSSCP